MYKVYIVDDEAAVVKGLCNAIDWDSYNVEIAGTFTDPSEALQALSETPVDILITDVRMPVYDGLTLMKKGKEINPALRTIVVSAYDYFDYVKSALKNGAENYLLKPVDINELQETLQKTLENLESEHQTQTDTDYNMLAFRSNILERWVRNTIQEVELIERSDMAGIDLQSDSYTVLYLYNNSPSQDIHSAKAILELAVANSEHIFKGHFFINHAFHVIGVLFGCSDSRTSIENFLSKMIYLTGKEGFSIFPVVSFSVSALGDVSKSYTLAEKYTSARHFGLTTVFCSDYPEFYDNIHHWQDDMAKLHEALNSRAPGVASNIAKNILENPTRKTGTDRRSAAFSIAVNIYYTLKVHLRTEKPSEHFLSLYRKFRTISNDDLFDWINSLIMHAEQILCANQELLHPYVRKSIEFIRSEANTDISLKSLAARFNVSPAYLGQLFRQQTGKYFNDYVTSVRLDWSKKLIAETDMKVSDIAKTVGFSSQTYFNRTFKQAFGTSPGEYRYKAKVDAKAE